MRNIDSCSILVTPAKPGRVGMHGKEACFNLMHFVCDF